MIANNFPGPDSAYSGVFNFAQMNAMRGLGHDPHVVRWVPWAPAFVASRRLYRSVPTRYAVDGIPVHTVRGLMGPRSYGVGTLHLQHARELRRIAASVRPDVVHVEGLIPAGVLALDLPYPTVLTAHGSETYSVPYRRSGLGRLARRIAIRMTRVVGVSDFVAGHLRAFGRDDARVIFNGADDAIFHPEDRNAARRRLHLPQERKIVSFIGDMERRKGVFDLVEAAARTSARPLLVLVGEGGAWSDVQTLAESRHVEVRFLGALPQAELNDVYAAADVFALPSYAEGLPSVICEAMNAGIPVVATAVGGIAEIVSDGRTGYVVAPGDTGALAVRLDAVLSDDSLAAAMRANALEFARAHLTWKQNALAYEAIYREIAS